MMKSWLFVGLPVLVCLCHYFQQSSALQRRDHLPQNNGLQSTGSVSGFVPLSSPSTLERTDNAVSGLISTNGGFNFGSGSVDYVYVSSNGFISMGESPTTNSPRFTETENIVSPYGADTDTSIAGTVRYTGFTSNTAQLRTVSGYIEDITENEFDGTKMMVVEWDNVAKAYGSASSTSHFQAVLITDGTVSYALFIYECRGMNWDGADIGWAESYYEQYVEYSISRERSSDIGCDFSSSYSAIVFRLRRCSYPEDYSCPNGQCVSSYSTCDGYNDCEDGSDEEYCYDNCYSYSFYCDNGECVDSDWKCDGDNDCGDNSDERNCVNEPLAIGLSVAIFSVLFFLGTPICVGIAIYYRARRRLRNRVISRTGGRVVTTQETSFSAAPYPAPHPATNTHPTQPTPTYPTQSTPTSHPNQATPICNPTQTIPTEPTPISHPAQYTPTPYTDSPTPDAYSTNNAATASSTQPIATASSTQPENDQKDDEIPPPSYDALSAHPPQEYPQLPADPVAVPPQSSGHSPQHQSKSNNSPTTDPDASQDYPLLPRDTAQWPNATTNYNCTTLYFII